MKGWLLLLLSLNKLKDVDWKESHLPSGVLLSLILISFWCGVSFYHLEMIKEFMEMILVVFGTVFAVLAMIDAHQAFHKAKQVEEAIGSFRLNFSDILEEMTNMVNTTNGRLSILIPTPAYGYLFGEPDKSKQLLNAIATFIQKDKTHLELYLVFGAKPSSVRTQIPQQYLRRADKLVKNKMAGVREQEYEQLIENLFQVISQHSAKVDLYLLKSDPNVRIIVGDAENPDKRSCLLSFAQSNPDDIKREFQSKGFKSTRSEMVQAMQDRLKVYFLEQGDMVENQDIQNIRAIYTVRQ